ncbi:MAG: hypothetical protein ACKPA9_05810 [Microcystis sp.]
MFGAVISRNWGALKRPDHFSSPWLPEKNRVGQLGQAVDYSVFQSAEVQKLWVLGKMQEAKGKREEK